MREDTRCTARPVTTTTAPAREDDPERAIRAGLAIVDAVAGSALEGAASAAPRPRGSAALHAMIDALADGVPLFVEELTKAVTEPGAAHGVEAIPATLADSLMARLDRLSAAKGVAQVAAVLGCDFSYTLLHAIVGARHAVPLQEPQLRHGLARLVDAEILFTRGGAACGHVHL